jgi:hypothetical protein
MSLAAGLAARRAAGGDAEDDAEQAGTRSMLW